MDLARIPEMDRSDLVVAWTETFRAPVPKHLSKPFIRRFVAFEIQAKATGGLPPSFVRKLEAQARQGNTKRRRALQPGGRLIREWNGVTHIVDVVDDGFLWNDQRYKSLSAVARTITGARWSGPRFFGLKVGASQ